MKLLNVGCGNKLAKCGDWINVDMVPNKKTGVIGANIIKGLPFSDNKFSVVYHSQVLEHFQKNQALPFLIECRRVLRKDGIIRIVVPDLQFLTKKYLECVDECLENDSKKARIEYEWILLQIFDQMTRNKPGGLMADFLFKLSPDSYSYISKSIGRVGKGFIKSENLSINKRIIRKLQLAIKNPIDSIHKLILISLDLIGGKYKRIGKFRLSGEIHYWMYDFYSLKKLLEEAGFKNIKKVSHNKSSICNWSDYELDVIDDEICDPGSLFVEANY